jgi:hypothetical protein
VILSVKSWGTSDLTKTSADAARVFYFPGKEVGMDRDPSGRREFLRKMTALGAAGLPVMAAASRPRLAAAAAMAPGAGVGIDAGTPYDPAAKFDVTVSDVEFRRTRAGRMLMARVYQPKGA